MTPMFCSSGMSCGRVSPFLPRSTTEPSFVAVEGTESIQTKPLVSGNAKGREVADSQAAKVLKWAETCVILTAEGTVVGSAACSRIASAEQNASRHVH